MSTRKTLLLCEEHKETEALLEPIAAEFGLKLVCTSHAETVVALAEEHRPELILLNIPAPGPVCHHLKMDSQLYHIPLFVIAPGSDRDLELQFLSNEFFVKPLQSITLREKIRAYLELRLEAETGAPARTATRERWVEKKGSSGNYVFEYTGEIDTDKLEALSTRIAELITVGRNQFTLNLLQASRIGNVPLSRFKKIQDIVSQAGGHLKILIHPHPISTELAEKGIDIDEYVELKDWKKDEER